jgi:hypothetical protein
MKQTTPKYKLEETDGWYQPAADKLVLIAGGLETARFFTECPKCGYSWKVESETESKNGGGERNSE